MSTLKGVQKFNSFGYSQLVLPLQSLLFDKNFENSLRKIGQANKFEIVHEAIIWTYKHAQKVWEPQGEYK